MGKFPKFVPDWNALLRQQLEDLLDFFPLRNWEGLQKEHEQTPLVDMYETAEAILIEAELPGFDREDLSLRRVHNLLLIEAVRREEAGENGVTYHCLERKFGHFCRVLEIPPTVDFPAVTASYDKGVLYIRLPRIMDKRQMIKEIPIE